VQPTIGFTGHVNDMDTRLTYMQQRYCDPVVTDASSGGSSTAMLTPTTVRTGMSIRIGRFAFLLPLVAYFVNATVVVVGHYVLPGRPQREESGRKFGNAILNNGNKEPAQRAILKKRLSQA
jgi:hypothetical protein